MKFLSKLSTTQKWIFGTLALVVFGVIFYQIGQASVKSKLQAELDSIDNIMSSGRASASDLVELRMKKKAILQQIIKNI